MKKTPGEPMSVKQKIKDYISEHSLGIVALFISIIALWHTEGTGGSANRR